MERAEAIKWLKGIQGCYKKKYFDLDLLNGLCVEAIDMAIEALSKPIVDITQRDLCADISCTDCPFMQETCKLMDYVAYADRPKGEWLDTGDPLMRTCSNCGYGVLIQNVNNFCPNCGADMRGDTND